MVTVPVLSSTTVSIVRVSSRTCGPLIRMPSWAPRPVPARSPTGVASPSAHGQAMTSTATAAVKAARSSASLTAGPAASSQPANVMTAMTRTTGTNTALMRSARRAMGALPVCAWETSRPIWARVVSEPTRVARTRSRPEVLMVAPVTVAVRADLHGHGFAGDQGGVHGGGAVDHDAVGGDLLAGPDHDLVARPPAGRPGSWFRCRRAAPWRPWRPGPAGPCSASPAFALGAGLEVAAEQQERGDDGGHLEVEPAGPISIRPCPACRRSSPGLAQQLPRPRRRTRRSRRSRRACPWWRRNAGR